MPSHASGQPLPRGAASQVLDAAVDDWPNYSWYRIAARTPISQPQVCRVLRCAGLGGDSESSLEPSHRDAASHRFYA